MSHVAFPYFDCETTSTSHTMRSRAYIEPEFKSRPIQRSS